MRGGTEGRTVVRPYGVDGNGRDAWIGSEPTTRSCPYELLANHQSEMVNRKSGRAPTLF